MVTFTASTQHTQTPGSAARTPGAEGWGASAPGGIVRAGPEGVHRCAGGQPPAGRADPQREPQREDQRRASRQVQSVLIAHGVCILVPLMEATRITVLSGHSGKVFFCQNFQILSPPATEEGAQLFPWRRLCSWKVEVNRIFSSALLVAGFFPQFVA